MNTKFAIAFQILFLIGGYIMIIIYAIWMIVMARLIFSA